jgi:hypothetical protein
MRWSLYGERLPLSPCDIIEEPEGITRGRGPAPGRADGTCRRSSAVEQRFRKPQVVGSNPTVGSTPPSLLQVTTLSNFDVGSANLQREFRLEWRTKIERHDKIFVALVKEQKIRTQHEV